MFRHYILEGHTPVPCEPFDDAGNIDKQKLSQWNEAYSRDRHVAETCLGQVRISTVFLGFDHGSGNVPILFETMIFGSEHDGYQERYATWEQAEIGHEKAVTLIRSTAPSVSLDSPR